MHRYGAARGGCIKAGGNLPTKANLQALLANATYRSDLSIGDGDGTGGDKCHKGADGSQCWVGRMFANGSSNTPPYCKYTTYGGVHCVGSVRNHARLIICKYPTK